jgi:serine/threonine protein kinase
MSDIEDDQVSLLHRERRHEQRLKSNETHSESDAMISDSESDMMGSDDSPRDRDTDYMRESIRESCDSWALNSLPPEMTSNQGTLAWSAPELLSSTNTSRYSVKVDVYSFGMVLWELWERRLPFSDMTSRFDIIDAIREGKRPDISDNCPAAYRALMQRCWQAEPSRRPTFKYIEKYLREELALVKRSKVNSVRVAARSSVNSSWMGPIAMSFSNRQGRNDFDGRQNHISLDLTTNMCDTPSTEIITPLTFSKDELLQEAKAAYITEDSADAILSGECFIIFMITLVGLIIFAKTVCKYDRIEP